MDECRRATRADSYPRAGFYDTILRDDDHPVADVVAIAVRLLNAGFVHQPRPVSDSRVLVDDHAVEDDVATNPEARTAAARRDVVVGFVVVGAEEHRALDRRAALDVGPDTDDRVLDRGAIEVA